MKPRISLITIAVDDLNAALQFYRDGLGLPTQGIIGTAFEYGAVAFSIRYSTSFQWAVHAAVLLAPR